MAVKFKIKHGEEQPLQLNKLDVNKYNLTDETGKSFFFFYFDDNNSIHFDGTGELDEELDELKRKLEVLLRHEMNQSLTGIEDDEEGGEDDENDPFDPEEVSIDTKLVTMETLLRRLEQGSIRLNPDFQRNEVWSDDRKSQLIESLLLNIPIPMFYVSSDEKSNWTVVDGLQRISTFRDFVLGKKYLDDKENNLSEKGNGIRLTKLEFWKKLEGKTMNELPTHLYNRVIETVFTFTIINPGTHEEVKRNIFKRLNTGGMPLSSQEIRNALYTGPSTRLLNELAKTEAFRRATCDSINAQRLEDRELILRFLSFLVRKPSTYRRTVNIDTWLSDTMVILNSLPELDTRELKKCVKQKTVNMDDIESVNIDDIRQTFLLAMERAHKLFGRHAFRKSTGDMRRRPINKSLFEAWGVLLPTISEDSFNKLYSRSGLFMKEYRELLDDPYFTIAISRDSMKHLSVKMRFEKLEELMNKYFV